METRKTTVKITAEITVIGEDADGETAKAVRPEKIAEIIKRRLDADKVAVTDVKISF